MVKVFSNQFAIVSSSIRCLTHKPSSQDWFRAKCKKGTCTIFITIWWWPLGLNNFLLLCWAGNVWGDWMAGCHGCLWLASEALGVKTTWNCIGHCLNCCGSRTLNFRLLFILSFISDTVYLLSFLFAFCPLLWFALFLLFFMAWATECGELNKA